MVFAGGNTFEGVPSEDCGTAAAFAAAGITVATTTVAERAIATAPATRRRPVNPQLENTADIPTPHQYVHTMK